MHGCYNLNATVISACLVVLIFLFFRWFLNSVNLVAWLKGFQGEDTWGFGIHFLKVSDTFFIYVSKLQSVFSTQITNLPVTSWRSQIDPDHLCLDGTELIQALLPNKDDKSCRSFRDGVGPCNQRFGSHNVRNDLSFDLSFVLSSICHSRDLMS